MIRTYLRFWMKNFALELQSDMIYKYNFFIKIFALMIADIIGPLVTILIYNNTQGIPGWSFEEFILFQGCFILSFGLLRTMFMLLPHHCIKAIRDGSFDTFLVKPFNTLLQLTLRSWNLEGIAEILTGTALIIYSTTQIGISLTGIAYFLVAITASLVFLYSIMVLIAAMAFLVVQSYALYDIFFKVTDFGRYPLSIYTLTTRFIFTFLFPIGVIAFYPANALLGQTGLQTLPVIILPVTAFFILSIILWNKAMKKYTSAGG